MLFLRLDQALQLLRTCHNQKEVLVVRYMVFNGLSPMEIAAARIEHLDPVECTLFLPRRHWKRNCICNIDPETVQLQAIYTGARKKGPLVRTRRHTHFTRFGIYTMIRRLAKRTNIPGKQYLNSRTLKRTFAREWLLSGGTVGSLQKQFGHKHLWSTAHYLRFVMEDVRRNHVKFMERVEDAKTESARLVS